MLALLRYQLLKSGDKREWSKRTLCTSSTFKQLATSQETDFSLLPFPLGLACPQILRPDWPWTAFRIVKMGERKLGMRQRERWLLRVCSPLFFTETDRSNSPLHHSRIPQLPRSSILFGSLIILCWIIFTRSTNFRRYLSKQKRAHAPCKLSSQPMETSIFMDSPQAGLSWWVAPTK
jgi:hypothetical protein